MLQGGRIMPGMTANLTPEAYAIWDGIPNKRKGVHPGRSAWISSVIIEHAGWEERYKRDLGEMTRLATLRKTQLETMTKARDKLQEIVLELTGDE
tara:strand:+ start:436 stop:720 length:285 start_codon:yes stop_codon:yes gene_type:complete